MEFITDALRPPPPSSGPYKHLYPWLLPGLLSIGHPTRTQRNTFFSCYLLSVNSQASPPPTPTSQTEIGGEIFRPDTENLTAAAAGHTHGGLRRWGLHHRTPYGVRPLKAGVAAAKGLPLTASPTNAGLQLFHVVSRCSEGRGSVWLAEPPSVADHRVPTPQRPGQGLRIFNFNISNWTLSLSKGSGYFFKEESLFTYFFT